MGPLHSSQQPQAAGYLCSLVGRKGRSNVTRGLTKHQLTNRRQGVVNKHITIPPSENAAKNMKIGGENGKKWG